VDSLEFAAKMYFCDINKVMPTQLYIVPTPIGNLKDMTFRAIEVLKEVDFILAEDTRTSGKLLKHYDIATPQQSYHMHNEHKIVDQLVQKIKNGSSMALITDAGTPGISDPGFLLVRACVGAGIKVETLPGATAFVPALVNSGLPADKFVFEGFLPVKKGRKTRLEFLKDESRTMIFYESPHKLLKTLHDFFNTFGSTRSVSVSRELSKLYEETVRGSLDEVIQHFKKHSPKGEIVIVVKGQSKN
jgi:16S rRNA (cytidine1402-2'-O)-methyltransferase